MNIAVYLGSNYGTNPHVKEETEKLGTWIGEHGHTLVYGGSRSGLMGTIAESTIKANGKVIGVQLYMFDDQDRSMPGISDFHLFQTFAERKDYMMNHSDAFIAIPGGTGTLDEISDIMVVDKLSQTHRPIILFNIDHYYDALKEQLDVMVKNGYLTQPDEDKISFCASLEEIQNILAK